MDQYQRCAAVTSIQGNHSKFSLIIVIDMVTTKIITTFNIIITIITRSYAALWAADLDWIVHSESESLGGGDVMKVGRVHWPVWADGFKRARFV